MASSSTGDYSPSLSSSPYYMDRFWFTSDGDIVVANRPHGLPEITMPSGDRPDSDERWQNHADALRAWIESE